MIKRFHFGNNKTCIDPTKAKYIISLSKQRKAKGILLLVDEQGKIYAKKHFPGYGVVSIVKAGDSYNLYSMRQNKHWKLHKKNTDLTSFSLMKKSMQNMTGKIWQRGLLKRPQVILLRQ